VGQLHYRAWDGLAAAPPLPSILCVHSKGTRYACAHKEDAMPITRKLWSRRGMALTGLALGGLMLAISEWAPREWRPSWLMSGLAFSSVCAIVVASRYFPRSDKA
jgi:hypothetical protein